jgi:FMN-dependent NADH-azoreductase
MTYLLRITVSPRAVGSHSRRFADQVAENILRRHAIGRIVLRDITGSAMPCIDSVYVHAMLAHTSREASSGVAALLLSEQLIEELEAAHALLIDTPVHNYTVPAALKTWIDHVVRVGRTFKSSPAGKVGTLRDRPTVVVSAAGGYFSGNAAQPDFLTPYLDAVLATIGIRSVRHIRLEGLTRGEDAVRAAYARANQELSSL